MMASYEALRAELLARIGTLERRTDRIEAELRTPTDRDWVERATEIENHEVLDYLDDATRADVVELRHAIERIDNGTYGRCQRCGGDISYARLEALPGTGVCARCAGA
jgi:DnaK suppressor protein